MRSFLRFSTGQAGYRLVDLTSVVEVIPMVKLAHTDAQGNPNYRGLLQYRGRVMPVFRAETVSADDMNRSDLFLIVTSVASKEVAIVADELDTIVVVPDDDCAQSDAGGSVPIEVATVEGQLQKIVNPQLLLSPQ